MILKKSILTIQDSKALNYLFATIFEKEFNVFFVNNYFEAFRHLQLKVIDVHLIIVNIPDENSDNFIFLKHMYTSSLFSNIPKVVISKSSDIHLVSKTKDLGVSLSINMPFDPMLLLRRVNEIINEKENRGPIIKNIIQMKPDHIIV
jgi:DNA-binding NtrC family response regulator